MTHNEEERAMGEIVSEARTNVKSRQTIERYQ